MRIKMKSIFTKALAILSFAALTSSSAVAQTTTTTPPPAPAVDHSYKPMTLKLTEDGKKFIRLITWHQIWFTATQNNPDTKDVNGNFIDGTNGTKSWTGDIALRRSRFLIHAQVSPRYMILSHWGINNQSFINGGATAGSNIAAGAASNNGKRPQLYMHDMWNEFAVVPGKLSIGAGLHYWNGISRLTSNSTLNFMTLDAPIFNWANIEGTDQFARQFGVYAKGQILKGRLDYRIHLNKPFVFGTAPSAVGKTAAGAINPAAAGIAVNVLNEHWSQGGYFKYMFKDKESNVYPFEVGSYLGSKHIFNIGAGFYRHKGATMSFGQTGSTTNRDSSFHDQLCFGADVIYEKPINKTKGTMFHALVTYYNYNFGPGYLRNIGILNEHLTAATLTNSWAGGGNSQPTIGTGSILYGQFGFKGANLRNGQSFMPYATVTYKNFERLADPSTQFGVGVNYFVGGHNAKITAEYQTRPIYKAENGSINRTGYKGQFILQTHIFL